MDPLVDTELLEGLGHRELTALLVDLEVERRRLEARIAAVVDVADRRGTVLEDGHRTVRGWMLAITNCSAAEATARMRTARLLRNLPECRKRLAAGEIGVDQVRLLAKVHANPRCADQLPASEALLVEHAQVLPFDDFRVVLQRWESLADADGSHKDHEASHARRTASISAVGSSVHGSFDLGALQGTAVLEIFERFCQAEFAADCADARARGIDQVRSGDLARTDAQRRADALVAIFMAAASTPPGSRAPEPVVNLVVDLATFEAHLAAGVGSAPVNHPDPAGYRDRRCESIDGRPIDPHDMVIAAVTGHVRRVVLEAPGTVVDLGRRRRLFSGAAREVLDLQDRRCLWPGCLVPATRCEGDHVDEWHHFGPTRPSNGAPACDHHNRIKSHGFRAWRDPYGVWRIRRPDGSDLELP
jgi:hypothetical protein